MTKIKTYLATLIREQKINIFSIDEYLTQISSDLYSKLNPDQIKREFAKKTTVE